MKPSPSPAALTEDDLANVVYPITSGTEVSGLKIVNYVMSLLREKGVVKG